MLFNIDQPLPQIPQFRCRNPRCGAKLKAPAAVLRNAFCSPSCEELFYARHCRVCAKLFSPKPAGKPRMSAEGRMPTPIPAPSRAIRAAPPRCKVGS